MGRHNLAEVDAAFSLLKLNACAKHEVLGILSLSLSLSVSLSLSEIMRSRHVDLKC